MLDRQGRTIRYLRLSVTDLCNLRCTYCMPEDGIPKLSHDEIMSVEEIEEIVRAASECGIEKVRVTGGEPLVRRGITGICAKIARLPGIKEVCLTTNGVKLKEMAAELRDAGVSRVNLSLDTLRPERFTEMTRIGKLRDVLDGIEAAADAGFKNIKINTVLIGGVNSDEILDFVELTRDSDIEVRFIELMPIGCCSSWGEEAFLDADAVLEAAPMLEPLEPSGVAELYAAPGYRGKIGLIRPMSCCFCATCDRIRITADGRLKPCLHSEDEIKLKGLTGDTLLRAIEGAILAKPQRHQLSATAPSRSKRGMNRIGG